jgi:hypothetical protein
VLAGVALAGAATLVQRQSRKAERAYPPRGQFVTAGGVRLHYVAKGSAARSYFSMATARWSKIC